MEKVSEMLNNLETEQIKFWNTFNQCATENEHLQFKLSRCSRKLDNLLKDIDSSKAANLEMVHQSANLLLVVIVLSLSGSVVFANISIG